MPFQKVPCKELVNKVTTFGMRGNISMGRHWLKTRFKSFSKCPICLTEQIVMKMLTMDKLNEWAIRWWVVYKIGHFEFILH